MIPLTGLQFQLMKEFYSYKKERVVFTKRERKKLWDRAVKRDLTINFDELIIKCPALAHQIKRSFDSGNNIQSAVFSECVYSQTFANIFELTVFVNCYETDGFIPESIMALLSSYHLSPRYVYSNSDKSRMLIQAGGCDGIDSALITVMNLEIYTIEFKEPGAKASEPDLPKYGEDGNLLVTEEFLKNYPQFKMMLQEQKGLNFFEVIGNNVHDFSEESISIAITNNYSKKYADVICTEDSRGFLSMIPVNQVSLWADISGEIRPAGRNHYKVWTSTALKRFLIEKNAIFENDTVTIDRSNLKERKQRGGAQKVSGYKINSLFFVYLENCKENGNLVSFNINDVRQLNPTITAKMFFGNLKHEKIKEYYNM